MMKRSLYLMILLGAALGMNAEAQQPPNRVFTEVGLDQKLGSWVPLDLRFRDEQGSMVTLRSLMHGKPVVLALVYYSCPMICTEVLNGMAETFRKLHLDMGKDYDVITVSINPNEQPELAAAKRAAYLKSYGRPQDADSWHFLTGEDSSIKPLAASVGFRYVYDTATSQYAHPTGIIVVTPQGQVARYLYGIDYPPKDLKFALMEASGNKVGTAVDKILLLCYHYDEATGKYGLVVLNAVRIGGILTLIVLGGIVGFYLRRERRQRRTTAYSVGIPPVNGNSAGARH